MFSEKPINASCIQASGCDLKLETEAKMSFMYIKGFEKEGRAFSFYGMRCFPPPIIEFTLSPFTSRGEKIRKYDD